jgi:hypothetical protein
MSLLAIATVTAVGLFVDVPALYAQVDAEDERDAMYHRYLRYTSYVAGWYIEPHWLADGNSFWYAMGSPDGIAV